MALAVHAIFERQRVALTSGAARNAPAIVPAAYLTFEIEGADLPASVILDKRSVPVSRTPDKSRAHFTLDAFRSVGFHCLEIADGRFYFATEDAKLKLDGILRLLHEVGRSGLGWGRQIFFSNGTALRDPRVDYAWLLEHAPAITANAREIAAAPFRRASYMVSPGRPGTGRVLVPPTLSLVRRRGLRVLEEDERGLIKFRGRGYSPHTVVVARRERSFRTVGNRRVARLLANVSALCGHLGSADLPADARAAVVVIAKDVRACQDLYPFSLLRGEERLPDAPAPEEIVDPRYSAAFDMYDVLQRELGWEAGIDVADTYAFVAFSDQIYQAFVAALIARAAGVPAVGPTLCPGLPTPSFRSDRFDIYYDTTPPSPEFQSWRNETSRPSDMRPDLTIVDKVARRGLLVDAKYRIDGERAPTSALNECQVYMHSFKQDAIAVVYPGNLPRMDEVSSGGLVMLEVALSPFDGVEQFVREQVWPRLQNIMQPLGG